MFSSVKVTRGVNVHKARAWTKRTKDQTEGGDTKTVLTATALPGINVFSKLLEDTKVIPSSEPELFERDVQSRLQSGIYLLSLQYCKKDDQGEKEKKGWERERDNKKILMKQLTRKECALEYHYRNIWRDMTVVISISACFFRLALLYFINTER